MTLQNAGRFLAGCLQRLASPILANPSLIIYMSMLVFVPSVGAMDEEGGECVNSVATSVVEAFVAVAGVAVAGVAVTTTTLNKRKRSSSDDESEQPKANSAEADTDSPISISVPR